MNRIRKSCRPAAGGLLWLCLAATPAWAAQSLELISNATTPTNSGPAGSGPSTAPQAVTIRNNTDNPTGNSFVATNPALTVTYSLGDQQYTLNTVTESSTGVAVNFGADANNFAPLLTSTGLYSPLSAVGSPASGNFTSTGGAAAGTGITVGTNAGAQLFTSTRAFANANLPTGTRFYMATLTLSFSQPVTNPVLHFSGLGGFARDTATSETINFSQEFEVVTSGVSLTRLSGNTPFAIGAGTVNGLSYGANWIYSTVSAPNVSCALNQAACGSVRINGSGLSTVSVKVYMRSNASSTRWQPVAVANNGDAVIVSVSLDAPTITVNKALAASGRLQATDQFTTQIKDAGGTVINSAANSTTTGTGATVTPGTGTTGATTIAAGATYTLTEAAAGTTTLSSYATSISCTNANAASTTVLPSGSGQSFTITPQSLTDNITCTLTNTPGGTIVIVKDAAPNDAQDFSFTTSGTGLSAFSLDDDSDATLSNTRTFVGVAPGSYTVTETATTGWSLTGLVCNDPNGSNSSGNAATRVASINVSAGETVTCTFTNTVTSSNLSITKTNTPSAGASDQPSDTVGKGSLQSYSIVVSNSGPGDASGSVLSDPLTSSLDCVDVQCAVVSGGATCPTVSVSSLQSGVALAALPANSSLRFTLSCSVK